MYFFAEDYIRFISNLKYYLSLDVEPLGIEDSKHKEQIVAKGNKDSPLGIIEDIEIVFVHYSNQDDAIKKWNSRKRRVNYKNLIVKYNDQNFFTDSCYMKFLELSYKNKIFFTSNTKYLTEPYCVFVEEYKEAGYVVDDINYSKKMDLTSFLNNI